MGPGGPGAAVWEVAPWDRSSVLDPGFEATDLALEVLESTLT